MNKQTFSLLTFFALITVAGIGLAALANRTTWWASITVTLTLTVIGLGILLAFAFERGPRAFWFGCTTTTACYMLVTFHPWFSGLGASLVTTRLLAFTWVNVEKKAAEPDDGDPFGGLDVVSSRWDDSDYERIVDVYPQIMLGAIFDRGGAETREIRSFFQIGHALCALTFGFLAGLLTYLLSAKRTQAEIENSETHQPEELSPA